VELIVHPETNDVVGEMGVREDLAAYRAGDKRWGVCIVQRAEVHVKVLYFVGPTGNQQLALCTGAYRPTRIDLRMPNGMGREKEFVESPKKDALVVLVPSTPTLP